VTIGRNVLVVEARYFGYTACSDLRKEEYFYANDLTRFWKTAGVLPVVPQEQHTPTRRWHKSPAEECPH
jgi:hypothetical protein